MLERGFASEEICALKNFSDKVLRQGDGSRVFIKKIGEGKFNVIVEGGYGVVTALKSISEKSLGKLSENYGWR